MKVGILSIVLLLVANVATAAKFTGKVVGVIDGDTITVFGGS